MIKQASVGLNSRSEANPFNKDGFLPLITAPMYSVVDENNYQIFLDNKIQVCIPRNTQMNFEEPIGETIPKFSKNNLFFFSYSLQDFINLYVEYENGKSMKSLNYLERVCIDTANGNIPALHNAIKKAKEIHGDNLIIMAGNVTSVEAFVELAKTGVDYIRVGIGGGGGCNTTSNTGIGQEDLEELIKDCFNYKTNYPVFLREHEIIDRKQVANINNVKIVADGISSYIKLCQDKYGFNDNGYAAINKLLFAGADLVMIGKLFAQCVESAGVKKLNSNHEYTWQDEDYRSNIVEGWIKKSYYTQNLVVKYSGMSTQEEQLNYKPLSNTKTGFVQLKPSEGSVQWIPVRWSLSEWLNGSDKQDRYPYLMGWINSIKSAMSYTGKTKLSQH